MDLNRTENEITVEPDMLPRKTYDGDSFCDKVFKNYPLIGDYNLSEKAYQKLYENVKKIIDTTLICREKKIDPPVYNLSAHEMVALIAVHFAKHWNSNEEGKFTKYVAMQLGYRDDNGRVWGIITNSLDLAFNKNNRLFLRNNGYREFYETIMAHSFGPLRSWYPLFDLLFGFYSENLDWNYVPDDPLFSHLVEVLQKKLNNDALNDEEYTIASKGYTLRVGVRRLVSQRPGYAVELFERIIRRMHLLVTNNAQETSRYSLQLVDNWFAERLNNTRQLLDQKKPDDTESATEVALNYKSISPKYVPGVDRLYIQTPAIRIISDYSGDAEAKLYLNGSKYHSYSFKLQIQGNELGETIRQKKIELKKDDFENGIIRLTLVITLGEDEIYNSGKTLWRQVIAFSNGKEISINRLQKESYLFFAVNPEHFSGKNAEIQKYRDTGICRITLHKDYSLLYNGNTIAIDTSEIKEIRIVPPSTVTGSWFEIAGEQSRILQDESSAKIYISREQDLKRYRVKIGENILPLLDYYDDSAGNRAVIPFDRSNAGIISFSLTDLENNTVVFQDNYYIIEGFNFTFDKSFYLPSDNTTVHSLLVKTSNREEKLSFNTDQETVRMEYGSGFVSISVPAFNYCYENLEELIYGKYFRYQSIKANSLLRFSNSTGYPFRLTIGNKKYVNPGTVNLKSAFDDDNKSSGSVEIVAEIDGKTLVAGTAVFSNRFVRIPHIVYKDNALMWDGATSYIGDKKAALSLYMSGHKGLASVYPLSIEEPVIKIFKDNDFVDGNYSWSIIEDGTERILAKSESFIGNESRARFADKIIEIDSVTEDTESNSARIRIKPVYIDQIDYIGNMYVASEDDVFDVYKGRLFWIDYKGDKRFYSFKYKDDIGVYKINPVKIIYINDTYLRIVTQDDDGIYCYFNERSREPGYEITDRLPAKKAKNYKDILFYQFTTNRKNHSAEDELPVENSIPDTDPSIKAPEREEPVTKDRDERKTAFRPEESGVPETENDPVETIKEPTPAPKEAGKSGSSLKNMKDVSQETVIKASVNERILVNAGPGTGKTWSLIEKIIYLVQEKGVDPESIQVLCFSRAAAEVIRSRLFNAILEGRADVYINYVDIRTFDSYASQLLYWVKESDYNSISKSFKIEQLNYDERIDLFIQTISRNPELISQCEHLIVDEVQDLVQNRARMVLEMIKALPKETGVTLLGDACQSIYDYQVEDGEMSSEKFYASIVMLGEFKFYSFGKNFRQSTGLQDLSEQYRKLILQSDIKECNRFLKRILEDIPDYDVISIKSFQENTLDRLLKSGNVGILTRSNAQALKISSIFTEKGIQHSVKRRLSENYLNGWIALMFNNERKTSYNEDEFINGVKKATSNKLFTDKEIAEIWDSVTENRTHTTGRISAKDLLYGINTHGRDKGLFTAEKNTPVTISTIHRSKGREYDNVIIQDSLLANEPDSLEEQRVNYVAVSRAKNNIYKVTLNKFYTGTLDNRRSYSTGLNSLSKRFLNGFEVGKEKDFEEYSFASLPGVQSYIREYGEKLINQEVYLEIADISETGVVYNLIMRSNGMKLATTSDSFSEDLQSALRKSKNLPYGTLLKDYMYPKHFTGLYIKDLASAIGIARGNEKGVTEYEGLITWNILLTEGFGTAVYKEQ